jgi:hypothetical protein
VLGLIGALVPPDAHAGDTLNLEPSPAQLSEAASSRAWKKLLHYRPNRIFPGYESAFDSLNFFLSPKGKTDSEAELRQSISLFRKLPENSAPPDSHAQCRFPARFQWIQEQFTALAFPKIRCPGFETFRSNLNAEAISLVFSSYFLNNPASAFGHSFLRLHRKELNPSASLSDATSGRLELLDIGVGYAAQQTTQNPVLYALYGIFGAFDGTFTALPYYYKVREYADSESRDLWSYHLNFDHAELNRLIAHLWEVGPATLDYYYFTENCAYVILTMLEAAKPELELTEQLPFYVAPAHTIQLVGREPGLVTETSYRPSAWSRFKRSELALNSAQKDLLRESASEWNPSHGTLELPPLQGLSHLEQVQWVDTAIDYFDYRFAEPLLREDPATTQSKQELLRVRAALASPSGVEATPMPTQQNPTSGHLPQRVGLGVGSTLDGKSYMRFQFRPTLHDLLDHPDGYPENAQIEFANLTLRLTPSHSTTGSPRVSVEAFDLFRVTSLLPMHPFQMSPSMRLQVSSEEWTSRSCNGTQVECQVYFLRGGAGLAYRPFELIPAFRPATLYGFLDADLVFGDGALRPGIGPALGLHWRMNSSLGLLAEVGHIRTLHYRIEGRWNWGKNWAVGATVSQGGRPLEGSLNGYYSF